MWQRLSLDPFFFMISLLRDWLFDPVALLFLLSLVLGSTLARASGSRSKSRSGSRSRRRRGSGKWTLMLMLWIVLYLVASAPVVVNPLLAQLEDRNLGAAACPVSSHVVLLSGGVDSRVTDPMQYEYMSNATLARAAAATRLLLNEEKSTVIVAGGALQNISEASVISGYLEHAGVEERRIIQEGRSANTRENALNVVQLLSGEELVGPLRLVTSALHMPRALATFRRALGTSELEICPIAVDFRALKNLPAWSWMPQTTAVVKFDQWLHEVLALLWYRHEGWI